jgi:hypothetical protein
MTTQHDPADPNREFRARVSQEFATGYQWTLEDVEVIAQSMVDDTLPHDLLRKIGPFPPDEFLSLVGQRVEELMRQKAEADSGVG